MSEMKAVAYLHTVVQDDGEQDQALSFSPDSFPLEGVGGFRSIACIPLFSADQWQAIEAELDRAKNSLDLYRDTLGYNPDLWSREARALASLVNAIAKDPA